MSQEDKNDNLLNNMTSTILGSTSTMAVAGAAILGGALLYYLNNNKQIQQSPKTIIDLKNQTRVSKIHKDGARISTINEKDQLFSCYYEDGRTLYELFLKAEKISNDGDYLGWKPSSSQPFKWLKYSQVNNIAQQIGSGFNELGLEPGKKILIGIYAKNRPEWVLTEAACNTYSFVNVPLYDTLGIEAINYVLLQTELKLVVCDDSLKAMQLMNSKSSLEFIIIIDNITDECKNKATELNVRLLTLDELKEIGQRKIIKPSPPQPDDLATICYTSGTTGKPKGAMITHANIVSIASSMLVYIKSTGLEFVNEQERYLSYLPLAHMFERVCQATLLSFGGKIGFYQGDIKKLSDDMKELKPTIFCTVPRLLNRVYSKITESLEAKSLLKKKLFQLAFAQKEKEIKRGIIRNNGFFDYFFKQIRDSLGGQVKFLITGSAPISPEVLHFMRVCCGCNVLEGYGATETAGASGVQVPGENTVGNVGPPFLCSMYKLCDVPEMNLVASRDNRGEICIFGTNVFKGYYKDEEKTKEAIDADGWYHTGDIGSFEENGTLKIVDRVKNIFKLQQGEYIAPEKIENIYVRSKYVAQVFVYGNSYKSTLIAVIVPEQTVLYEWARENGLEEDMTALCKNANLKKLILKDMTQHGKAGDLKGFEQVKDIFIHDDLFSIENGLLTPTMKSKRNELQKKFQPKLDQMYTILE